MKFRVKLTLLFIAIFLVILISAELFIYVSYSNFRKDEFYKRLENKAVNTSKLLFEVHEIDMETMRIIDKNSINNFYHEKVTILDTSGNIIYSGHDKNAITYNENLLNNIKLKGRVEFSDKDDSEVIGIYYEHGSNKYIVLSSAYDFYGRRKLSNLSRILLISFFFGVILISTSAFIYVKTSYKPIGLLNKTVQQITENNLRETIEVSSFNDEFKNLARNFNEMLTRLNESFELRRNFVQNASHELRTPLTRVSGLIDVALNNKGLDDNSREILRFIRTEQTKMSDLIANLLLLSRLNSGKADFAKTAIRMDDALMESIEDCNSLYPDIDINVDFKTVPDDEAELIYMGNKILIKTVFSNLLNNAALYNINKAIVVIIDPDPKRVQISFSNVGKAPLYLNKLLEPFHRGLNSQNTTGHGLGLSIVHQILTLHKGTLDYKFLNSEHVFVVTFESES